MKFKKALIIFAACVLFVSAFAGCGANSGSAGTSSQNSATAATTAQNDATTVPAEKTPYQQEIDKGPVTLTYYQLGDNTPDEPKVWEELNKLFKRDINVTVNEIPISWADASTKYQLIFNSGEDFDAVLTAGWQGYTGLATKNGFYEISDQMLQDYAPNSAPQLLDDFLKGYRSTFVNGKSYMLGASYTDPCGLVAVIRGDLRVKYGVPEVKSFADLYTYFKAIGTKETGLTPLTDVGAGLGVQARWVQAWLQSKAWQSVGTLDISSVAITPEGKVFSVTSTPEYLQYAKDQNELQQLGCISKSANANKDTKLMDEGKTASNIVPIKATADPSSSNKHPDWKLEIVNIDDAKILNMRPQAEGFSIHATSKHPERTLMMLDLLRSNKEYADLLNLGIAGTHYTPVGDNQFTPIAGAEKTYPTFGVAPWQYIDSRLIRISTSTPQAYIDANNIQMADMKYLPSYGFVPDDSQLQSQIAAINQICATYGPLIDTGLAGDPVKAVNEFSQKLKDAGIDTIVTEYQTQLDKFIASNK